jgi:hypothetical protein
MGRAVVMVEFSSKNVENDRTMGKTVVMVGRLFP